MIVGGWRRVFEADASRRGSEADASRRISRVWRMLGEGASLRGLERDASRRTRRKRSIEARRGRLEGTAGPKMTHHDARLREARHRALVRGRLSGA